MEYSARKLAFYIDCNFDELIHWFADPEVCLNYSVESGNINEADFIKFKNWFIKKQLQQNKVEKSMLGRKGNFSPWQQIYSIVHFPMTKQRLFQFCKSKALSIEESIAILKSKYSDHDIHFSTGTSLCLEMILELYSYFERKNVAYEIPVSTSKLFGVNYDREIPFRLKRIRKEFINEGFEYESDFLGKELPNILTESAANRHKRSFNDGAEQIETVFSDDEAMMIVGGLDNGTAKQLWRKFQFGSFTKTDLLYAHHYAMECVKKYGLALIDNVLKLPPVPFRHGNFTKLFSEFDRKAKRIYDPVIEFKGLDLGGYSITFYSKRESNVTKVNKNVLVIKDISSKRTIAKIHRDGRILPSFDELSKPILNLLIKIGSNPNDYSLSFGYTSGYCVFCDRPLTDDISLRLGYGKTCAENHGMYWGSN